MREEDLKSMKEFEDILEKELRKEVKRIVDAGAMNSNDVKSVYDAVKLMLRFKEYECDCNDDYSRGHMPMYDEYSYAPARNRMTGRYMSRTSAPYADHMVPYSMGYSGHSTKDRMIARLEDMMGEAKNDYEASMIRDTIDKIRTGN